MQYYLNGDNITNQQFETNGFRYPANWCELATPEERSAIGITEVEDPPLTTEPDATIP